MLFLFKYKGAKTKAIVDVKYRENLDGVEVDAIEVASSTFERLKLIYRASEAFVILPGGVGTLSELLGLIEAKRTRNDNMEIIIYNYDNYYSKLLELLSYMRDLKFIDDYVFSSFKVVDNIEQFKSIFERKLD